MLLSLDPKKINFRLKNRLKNIYFIQEKISILHRKIMLFNGHSVFVYYKIATTLQQAFMIHQLSIKVPSLSSFTLRIKHNQCTALYGHHPYPNSLYFPQTHSFCLFSFMMNFSPKTYYTFLCIRYLFSLFSQSLSLD